MAGFAGSPYPFHPCCDFSKFCKTPGVNRQTHTSLSDRAGRRVEGEKLEALKDRPKPFGSVLKHTRALNLWTKRGAARHAKMINTDPAWDVFEKLEDAYFNQARPAPEPESYNTQHEETRLQIERERLQMERESHGVKLMGDIMTLFGDVLDAEALQPSGSPVFELHGIKTQKDNDHS